MKKRKKSNIWMSISDLMAGVLGIFIIYFVIQSMNLQIGINQISKERTQYKEIVDRVIDTKIKVIDGIKKKLDVTIDEKTGAIKLNSAILFESDKSQLKPEGKRYLKKLLPKYFEILLADKNIRENLSGIIIEGHTDKQGSYLYNLNLSQRRAMSVAEYVFSPEFPKFKGKKYLQSYLTANGRSYSFYLGKAGTKINKKSRRVEIKFSLNDTEALEELNKLVEKNGKGE